MAAPEPADGFISRRHVVEGLRLHVRERVEPAAAEPPWVLLHGLAVSHRYLMPTAVALTGHSVYIPDLPGFGLSQRPAHVYDVVEHAHTVAAWMTMAGIAGAKVLGNSFGCQVAVELAIRRPDLAAVLVLVSPTVDPTAPTAAAQIRRAVRDLVHEDPRLAGILVRDLCDAGVRRPLATLRHSVHHHIDQRLPLVDAPTLVLRGQYDPIAPARWVEHAAALAPHARAGEVRWAAHTAVTTAGPVVAAQALTFVSAHAAPRPPGSAD
jgi:pimeloyl-ACP methyl ester carboxylesterase